MSWLENLDLTMTIVTGDGKQWQPLYFKPKFSRDFNVAEFNYINISGTHAPRRLPKGRRLPLEIAFAGADCIDTALAFDKSAGNSRPWTIAHPVYGTLTVTPLDLSVDNTNWNISRITVTVVETIFANGQPVTVDAPTLIATAAFAVTQQSAGLYSTKYPTPSPSALQSLSAQVHSIYGQISGGIRTTFDATNFLNTYNDALTLINSITVDSYLITAQTEQLMLSPVTFILTQTERVKLLGEALFASFLSTYTTASSQVKSVYELFGGSTSAAMCAASITSYSYNTRIEVVEVIDLLIDGYNTYLANLDRLQSNNGSEVGAYIADPGPLRDLTDLVNYTIATLYGIAEQAKQVRTIYLPEDTTVTLATFRYFGGLDEADANLTSFIDINQVGLNELLILKKGRKIIYFV